MDFSLSSFDWCPVGDDIFYQDFYFDNSESMVGSLTSSSSQMPTEATENVYYQDYQYQRDSYLVNSTPNLTATAQKVEENIILPASNLIEENPFYDMSQNFVPLPLAETNTVNKRDFTIFNQSSIAPAAEKPLKSRKVSDLSPQGNILRALPPATIPVSQVNKKINTMGKASKEERSSLTKEQKKEIRKAKNRVSAQATRDQAKQQRLQLQCENSRLREVLNTLPNKFDLLHELQKPSQLEKENEKLRRTNEAQKLKIESFFQTHQQTIKVENKSLKNTVKIAKDMIPDELANQQTAMSQMPQPSNLVAQNIHLLSKVNMLEIEKLQMQETIENQNILIRNLFEQNQILQQRESTCQQFQTPPFWGQTINLNLQLSDQQAPRPLGPFQAGWGIHPSHQG